MTPQLEAALIRLLNAENEFDEVWAAMGHKWANVKNPLRKRGEEANDERKEAKEALIEILRAYPFGRRA